MGVREIMESWYTFNVLPTGSVCILQKNITPAKMFCMSREELQSGLQEHKFNPFLTALYKRAMEELDAVQRTTDQTAIVRFDTTGMLRK